MLLLVQSIAGIGFATTETGEYSEYVEETRENLTNMKALQTLIGYFGVDYFSIATSENTDQSSAKNRIQEMINNPNAVMTNYDLISLMSEMVDVEERVVQMEESKGTVTNATVSNSSLINFLKLGYLDDTEAFSPSSHANAESMQMLLDNMLGYVVRTEEDLKQIPSDVKTITIVDSGINIEDMTLDADILITSKAKEGISFKNSTINGMIEISGGTETSPVSVEGTSVNKIIMAKSAYETSVSIGAGSSVESLKSKMDTSIVVEKGAQVDTVWSEGNTVLKTESGAVVSSLIANADTKVVGDNVIEKVFMNSASAVVETPLKESSAAPAVIENKDTGSRASGSSKKHSGGSSSGHKSDGSNTGDITSPAITQVQAINKYQVLVKYDEPILNMGTYKITDLNGNKFSDYLVLCGDEEDEVLIQIDATKPFSSDVTYYLIQNEKAQDESLNPAADAGTVQFSGSDVEYRFKSYQGNTLINGTTFTFTNSAGQPDGLYTVTSGSAVNADLLVAFEIEDGKVLKTSGNALENIKVVENSIVVELDDMYALLDHQKYDCTIKMKQPSFYYDYNGNINGIVERLDIEAATLSSITFDELEYDEDFEIVLIVNGESHVVTESMIVYETVSYNFSSGDRIMVIVLDKDTKNVYSRSETYIIK